jgi:hypothetical protein
MEFNQQPSGIVGANSPLIYQFYDANFASAGFYYKVQIFVWTGGNAAVPATPQATIERVPDTYASGRAFIDTHKIVQQYLTTDFFQANTDTTTIGGGAVWTLVKVQGFYTTGASSNVTALITSSTVLATNGYTYMASGINTSLTTSGLFTSKTKFIIPQGATRYYVWFDASVVTELEIDTTAVNPVAVTTNANRIQGVDLVELYNDSGVSGNATLLVTTTTTQFSFAIERPCENRYGQIPLHFLNRWGVYETYIFNALHRNQIEITRETYQQALFAQTDMTAKWAYGYQMNTPYLVNAKEQYTLNTNYIPENDNDSIQQMQLSDNILIDDNGLKSATITDTSLPFKTRTNDKLIDYTIQLSVNSPVINKVVR